jgi:hypothetical protein
MTPRLTTRPEDVGSSDRLRIACTQTRLPGRQQAALVDSWCEALPSLRRVRLLWLESHVPPGLFEAACKMRNLRGLYIKWSTVTDIDSLASLGQLRYLHIGQSTPIRSIQVLGHLAGLKWLGLENLKRISDISPLGRLVGLEGLALLGGIASNWHLRTLRPLSRLQKLRFLSLLNLRPDDMTLAPLFSLTRLQTFEPDGWSDPGEIDTIRRGNSKLVVAEPRVAVGGAGARR